MIEIVDKSNERCVKICDALDRGATSIKMDGHYYIIINNGDSLNTNLKVIVGTVPLLNVKSRGIRVIESDVLVEIVDLCVSVVKSV